MTQDKPKLSLKRSSLTRSEDAKPRARSGSLARKVKLNQLEQNKVQKTTETAPRTAAYSKHPPTLAERLARGQKARYTRPESARSSRPRPESTDHQRPYRTENESPHRTDSSDRRRHDVRRNERRTQDSSQRPRGARPLSHSIPKRQDQAEIFPCFAPCPVGLESVLANELNAIGLTDVEPGRSGCRFQADWKGVMRANLYSRIAIRILVQVAHSKVETEDDIYQLARQVAWERWFGAEQTLRVDTSAIHSPMQSLQFCNLRAKDGVVDHLRDLEGARPSIDTVRPDAKVHLFLDQNSATLYLDTSGESLFKRGWRFNKGQAPLRENLAAGILALAGWDPSKPLYDPFCGSGTILIEAAWIAQNVPPGINRPFGFERLRNFNRHQWFELKQSAFAAILPQLETPLLGTDIDPMVIQAAKANLDRAQLSEDAVRFEVANALDSQIELAPGFLITNPPYGERLGEENTEFWRSWSSVLKRDFAGWGVHVITNDMTFPQKLRLKPRYRKPVFNGDIECRLFSFEMVAQSYRNQ